MIGFRLKFMAFVMVAILAIMAVQKINHSVNYVPAVATVSAVSSECHLEKRESGVFSRRRTYTDDMDCRRAEALRSGSAYADMTVKGLIDVTFRYVSPVDGSFQSGSLKYGYENYNRIAKLGSGDRLPILAHKTRPGSVAHDYSEALDPFATPE